MMGSMHYEVELILCQGKDLKNVNWRNGVTRPYAVVYVDNGPKRASKVDEERESMPTWNQTLIVPTPGPLVPDNVLFIDVVHAGNEEGTKPLIGQARVRLGQILDEVGPRERVGKTLKLKRPSGRPQGKIDVFICIQEPRGAPPLPHAYPSQHPVYGGASAPPLMQDPHHYHGARPTGYPMGSPPPGSYCQTPGTAYGQRAAAPPAYGPIAPPAYSQQAAGPPAYGQPAAAHGQGSLYGSGPPPPAAAKLVPAGSADKKKKKKKIEMGLKTGLAAGALGGLAGAIGRMALGDSHGDGGSESESESESDSD